MGKAPYILAGLAWLMLLCPFHGAVSEETTRCHDEKRAGLAMLNLLDSEDVASVRSAEANFRQRDWDEGMEKILFLFNEKPDMLIPTEDCCTFVSVWEYFHNSMIALPPPATEAYRGKDSDIVKRFEKAKSEVDINTVREIVRDHLFTKPGRAALRFLIEHYYERRQFTEALSCVSRFEKYLAFDRSDSVWVAATKLLCLARTGRVDEFDTVASRLARRLADEEIKWHGAAMPFSVFVERLSLVVRAVERRDSVGPLLSVQSGTAVMPRFGSAYDAGSYPPEESQSPDIMAKWQAETPFTDVYPVFCDGTVYVRLRSSLFALDLDRAAGPRWKRHFPEHGTNNRAAAPAEDISRMAVVYAAAAHDGRVFTTFRDRSGILGLICLDAKSGKDLWTAGMEGGKRVINSAHAISPPTCSGESVYVTAVFSLGAGGDGYYLVRLNAADGGIIYSTFLCTHTAFPKGEVLYPPAPVVVSDGTVYVATNAGAVCAVDAMSGRLRWVTLYDRFSTVSDAPDMNRFERASRREVSFAYGAPLVHRGVIVAAPPEADRLIAMDAENGRPLWLLENSSRRYAHLVGAGNGAVFLSGWKVGAFDVATGRPLWPSEPDLGTRADGRGFLAGNLLVVPGDGIFTFVDIRDGRVIARNDVGDLLQKPASVKMSGLTGNLLHAGDRILSASRCRITVYPARKAERDFPDNHGTGSNSYGINEDKKHVKPAN